VRVLSVETLLAKALAARGNNIVPFKDAGDLPWDDPLISQRLLAVHLDPTQDLASRPPQQIRKECAFIERLLHLYAENATVLCDMTCGPGLYAAELAHKGYRVTGVDFSPASIAYARQQVQTDRLHFILSDIRTVELPAESFDANLFIYGQPNAFTRDDLQLILERARAWTRPGGLLLLEMMPADAFRQEVYHRWEMKETSIFADTPHLWMEEKVWYEPDKTHAHIITMVDQTDGRLTKYSVCHTGYEVEEIEQLLAQTGWRVQRLYGDMTGETFDSQTSEWQVIVAAAV